MFIKPFSSVSGTAAGCAEPPPFAPWLFLLSANSCSSTTTSGELSSGYAVGSSGSVSPIPSGKVYAIAGGGSVEEVGTSGGGEGATAYRIDGSGRGHNIGMSQWGAYSMAKYYDKTYDEILKFYFTGITIAN